jgi:cytochrome c oxidase subunit 1/cytochrome c oxidase subunit I+III
MTISIFSAVQVFAWIATMWLGTPIMTTAMCFAVGFIAVFVIGGLNGITTAVIPFDWQLTDTYFVVSHLHYVLVGANMFPVFAGFYYWLPKITGRMMNETAGRVSFATMFVGFNMVFFPMHLVGLLGMPRRIYTYPASTGWGTLNLIITIGAFILAVGILISIVNFVVSMRRGPLASHDPWKGDTLEWEEESPPAVYGTPHIPAVATRHPLWDEYDEHTDPGGERFLDHERVTIATTPLDGEPFGLAKMPEESLMPLALALALTGAFTALLFKAMWFLVGAILLSLAFSAWWLWPKPEKRVE